MTLTPGSFIEVHSPYSHTEMKDESGSILEIQVKMWKSIKKENRAKCPDLAVHIN